MIVTIDGPAGAGKSSVARALARKLGFRFLDTGAMYRAVALAAVSRNLPWDDSQVAQLAADISIEVTDDRVFLDGEDVTGQIRRSEITSVIHHVADNQQVRRHLVGLQRRIAAGSDIVTEGRDQGTVVFPHAECKIFLTASPGERALRRLQDLRARGEDMTLDEVLAEQNERDQRDSSRPIGGLLRAADAIELSTDGLKPHQVVDRLVAIVQRKQQANPLDDIQE
jgi:cytidylate kinase